MNYLILKFTNMVFACVLQSADVVTGPWQDIRESYASCPEQHIFAVPMTNTQQFFRLRLLDTGVPTPENVHAFTWTNGTSIAVDATLEFNCDDSQAGPTEFWRSYNDGEFVLVRTLVSPHFVDADLPPGIYRYKARIVGGLFSPVIPTVTL